MSTEILSLLDKKHLELQVCSISSFSYGRAQPTVHPGSSGRCAGKTASSKGLSVGRAFSSHVRELRGGCRKKRGARIMPIPRLAPYGRLRNKGRPAPFTGPSFDGPPYRGTGSRRALDIQIFDRNTRRTRKNCISRRGARNDKKSFLISIDYLCILCGLA